MGYIYSRRWNKKFGTAGGNYDYGWPSGGTSEPDVALQFLFDESGDIVDEVAGVTLTAAGTPTYSKTSAGLWANLSPGILCDQSDGFAKATATAEADLGTSDFVVEWAAEVSSAEADFGYYFSTYDGVDGYGSYQGGGTTLVFFQKADGTTRTYSKTITDIRDNTTHKYRYVGDRSANAEMFIDGVSQGTYAISPLELKNITATKLEFNQNSASNRNVCTYYEWRLTVGNLTNNSGGPGGG